MSLNGVWSCELGSAYGWEPVGTLFLRDGHLQGCGRHHYTHGTYQEEGDGAVFRITLNQYGKKRTLFGRKSEQLCVVVTGKRDGDEVVGEATLPGQSQYAIHVLLRRRAELPEENFHADSALATLPTTVPAETRLTTG